MGETYIIFNMDIEKIMSIIVPAISTIIGAKIGEKATMRAASRSIEKQITNDIYRRDYIDLYQEYRQNSLNVRLGKYEEYQEIYINDPIIKEREEQRAKYERVLTKIGSFYEFNQYIIEKIYINNKIKSLMINVYSALCDISNYFSEKKQELEKVDYRKLCELDKKCIEKIEQLDKELTKLNEEFMKSIEKP